MSAFVYAVQEKLRLVANVLPAKPVVLVGGLAIAAGYGLTHLPSPPELLSGLAILGLGLWGVRQLRHRAAPASAPILPTELRAADVQRLFAQVRSLLERFNAEPLGDAATVTMLQAQLQAIEQSLGRSTLAVQIVGNSGVGKTSLEQMLVEHQANGELGRWQFVALEQDAPLTASAVAPAPADVVLFLIQGDLTQSEWQVLQGLQQHSRVLLVLNKIDQYLPQEADRVLASLKLQVNGSVAASDVLAIATRPRPIKVRKHQTDGTFTEQSETPPPQLHPLVERLRILAEQEASQCILRQAYQQALALQEQVQSQLNQHRQTRAMPVIERYQWLAAGATFVTPLPSLDMVATAAITGKMIQELAALYEIQLSVESATEMAGALAQSMVQLGLVELSTQLLGSVLKGNAATFVAGGLLQGVSASYLTRMAGLSLVEIFQIQPVGQFTRGWQLDRSLLTQTLKRVFQQHQRLDVCRELAQKTLQRCLPSATAEMA